VLPTNSGVALAFHKEACLASICLPLIPTKYTPDPALRMPCIMVRVCDRPVSDLRLRLAEAGKSTYRTGPLWYGRRVGYSYAPCQEVLPC
jgi:hypothetical protein